MDVVRRPQLRLQYQTPEDPDTYVTLVYLDLNDRMPFSQAFDRAIEWMKEGLRRDGKLP